MGSQPRQLSPREQRILARKPHLARLLLREPGTVRIAQQRKRTEAEALTCKHNMGKADLSKKGCGGCSAASKHVCALFGLVGVERCMNCDSYEKK